MPVLLNSKTCGQLARRHRCVNYFIALCRGLLGTCLALLIVGLGFILVRGSQGLWHTCLKIERVETRPHSDGGIGLVLSEVSLKESDVLRNLLDGHVTYSLIKTTSTSSYRLPLSEEADAWYKGFSRRPGRMPSHEEITVLKKVSTRLTRKFSVWGGDSSYPQRAGFVAACWGSMHVVLIALCLAFPLSLATAITLEEFFPRGRLKDSIDVQLSNLSAVPSILFGLLGFAVFEQGLGLPHGSSLLGGLTLALMTCPTLIAVMRLALKMVPKALKESALALGASPLQVVWHHILPAATPTMMTGTLLSVGRVLGESASLLLVGLSGFVGNVPETIFAPSTVLPLQIFMWCKNASPGFESKMYGGILILLFFLLIINLIASRLARFSRERQHV